MTAGTASPSVGNAGSGTVGGSTFRPEIQGLRGLAVALVVLYHVWVGRVSGGVDVFLVLSGFFMVGQFARRAGNERPLDVAGYWRRTAGRIVPPAMVVLAGTVVASLLFLPETRWTQTLHEVVASAFFVENWRLAADAVDYYAAKNTASVVQHFWSLSIQGQFYVLFPLVVLGVVVIARRAHRDVVTALAVALIGLSALSLAFSIWLTSASQQVAYFHSAARLWEFTLGGLLALFVTQADLPARVRVVLGWLGVLGLVSCGLVLDVAGGFPGYLALWPVACAGLIIVAGRTGMPWAADRVLASRPAGYLGDLSFSLYLWHWPVLILALAVERKPALGPISGLLVIVTSLLLAAATRALVEVPLRRRRDAGETRWSDHRLAVVAVALVGVLVLGWQTLLVGRAGEAVAVADPEHPGAAVLAPGYVDRSSPGTALLPTQVALGNDWSQPIGPCRPGRSDPTLEVCERTPAGPASRHVVVVGDSHAQQLVPMVLPTAEGRGWKLTTMLKGACAFSLGPDLDPACQRWNTAAINQIVAERPDAVIVQASHLQVGGAETTPPEFRTAWQALAERGIPVLAVRDNPRYEQAPSWCVFGEYGGDASCAHPRATAVAPVPSYETLPDIPSNTSFIDLTDRYCLPDVCPPSIGNVLVYIDNNHISASYARTMAPAFVAEMERRLGW